nr:hypothetical protein [Tanacetum cinerariifolium]
MLTTNQGMSFTEIKKIVAQRVANGIKTIAIYKEKTNVARDLMNWFERQKDKVGTRGSGKVTTMEALANNKTKSI